MPATPDGQRPNSRNREGTRPQEVENNDAEIRTKLLDAGPLRGRWGSGLDALDGAGSGFLPIARLAQMLTRGKVDVSAGRINHDPGTLHERGLAVDLAVPGSQQPEENKDKVFEVLKGLAPLLDELIYTHTAYFSGQEQRYDANDHLNHVHVGLYPQYKDSPERVADAVVAALNGRSLDDIVVDEGEGGGGGGSGGVNVESIAKATAFSTFLQLPGLLDTTESLSLMGERSLMNDKPLLPFIQQICEASLRNFQSMPNGNFYAFFPDYFGGLNHRTAYWVIEDIEIIDGQINLTDDALATHVYIVGDIVNFDGVNIVDRIQSGGVVTIFNAFLADFLTGPPPKSEVTTTEDRNGDRADDSEEQRRLKQKDAATEFIKKYGARPYYDEAPMVRSPYYEAFLAYQRFMLMWSRQFLTTFTVTFMPELFPGGIVAFPNHGIQCYIDEVEHTCSYETGFVTRANLSAPSAIRTTDGQTVGRKNAHVGMVRAALRPEDT